MKPIDPQVQAAVDAWSRQATRQQIMAKALAEAKKLKSLSQICSEMSVDLNHAKRLLYFTVHKTPVKQQWEAERHLSTGM